MIPEKRRAGRAIRKQRREAAEALASVDLGEALSVFAALGEMITVAYSAAVDVVAKWVDEFERALALNAAAETSAVEAYGERLRLMEDRLTVELLPSQDHFMRSSYVELPPIGRNGVFVRGAIDV